MDESPKQSETPEPEASQSQQPSFAGYYRGQEAAKASAIDQVIPVKNGMALIAYYLGVFAIIPCFGLFLGPAALVCGVLGLKKVAANPELPGKAHAWVGIVLGALTGILNLVLVVWVVMNMRNR